MAVMREPGVNVALIDASGSGLMSRYDIACVHTIVGRDPANAAHFSTGGYGEITQSRDTRYRSAANLNGNYRVLAIENEDRGAPFLDWNVNDGHAVPAFTAPQMESIARILAWCHRTHGIPLVFVTDSRPTTRGVAFHRAGCDGNFAGYAFGGRVAGGELWSGAYGKVCPGDRRIIQLRDIIIPRARVIAGLATGPAPQPGGDFLMALTPDQQQLMYDRTNQMWDVLGAYYSYRQAKHGDAVNHPIGLAIGLIEDVLGSAYDPATNKNIGDLIKEMAVDVDELEDDERTIVAAIRDPSNPANAEIVNRVLGGLTALLEAHERPDIVVGPEHVQALAEALVAAVPEQLRPVIAQEFARVLTRGTEEYPPAPAG